LKIAVTSVPFAFATAHTDEWWLMAVLLVRGFGLGLVLTPLMAVAYVGLDRAEMPDASIVTRIAQQLGGSLGTAVLAVVLESGVRVTHTPAALTSGFQHAFWWAVGATALGVILSLLLPGRPAARRG
ncbi:MAG: MFS transporter, partial [Actinobacteria bacterium]|nr:MFS transporter [Actinomycetota bacterium]